MERLRHWLVWLVWIGGWEHPRLGADGTYCGSYFSTRHADGTRARPTPIALFGHRIVFYERGIGISPCWRRPF